jgi:hypothetical protein
VGAKERLSYLLICPIATATAISLIVFSVVRRGMSPAHGGYLILLLALFALTFTLFLNETVVVGDRIRVESNWGGLGGGLSGWSISNALVFLLLTVGFLTLLAGGFGTDTPQPDVRERYRTALTFAALNGIKFGEAEVVGRKLMLKGTAPTQAVANEFWNQVKLANPLYDDLSAELTITKTPGENPASAGPAK